MITRHLIASFLRLLAGVRLASELPAGTHSRIYFANHSSHMDFVVIWAVLPPGLRARARPVAAADYWGRAPLRGIAAFFRAVLVARQGIGKENNPLEEMAAVLEAGEDLILFPEGTRSKDGILKEFRAGLYHLAKRFRDVELVPVHLENLHRILPKGELLPVPILGHVAFGPPISPLAEGEPKTEFLHRAREAVLALGVRP